MCTGVICCVHQVDMADVLGVFSGLWLGQRNLERLGDQCVCTNDVRVMRLPLLPEGRGHVVAGGRRLLSHDTTCTLPPVATKTRHRLQLMHRCDI